jgi:hypothetical protein
MTGRRLMAVAGQAGRRAERCADFLDGRDASVGLGGERRPRIGTREEDEESDEDESRVEEGRSGSRPAIGSRGSDLGTCDPHAQRMLPSSASKEAP